MFKTNLIKNSLARRNKQRTSANQTITSFFSPSSRHHDTSANPPNLNETFPNTSTNATTPCKVGSMMLRRHSMNGNEAETTNGTVENLANSFAATASAIQENVLNSNVTETDINQVGVSVASPSKKSQQNSKFMTILMKTTCPKYYQIPNSSRKRILRFLCDNGWIDVS